MLARSTSLLTCAVIFSGMLLACQEAHPEGYWRADNGVDAGDADVADGERDAADVPDMRVGDARDGGEVDGGSECSEDTDNDALTDCEEADLCTDPTEGDTDGDGLSDFEELDVGTDPCKADTDDDGAEDKTELEVGLNPNKPSTFDDGILDGNRWRVDACHPPDDPDQDLTGTIDYYTNDTGNYRIGLPPGFGNYRQLALTGRPDPIAAGVFSDPSNSVYGFILSKSAQMDRTRPDTSLREAVRPEILALAGDEPDNLQNETNGVDFETHDYQSAAIGRYLIESPTEKSASQVRQDLLVGMDAFNQEDIGGAGLPSTDGQTHDTFWIFVSVIFRSNRLGPSQALISAAVAPASIYESRDQVPSEMGDLTDTNNIAEVADDPLVACERFAPDEELPKAYFYWVLDQSESMTTEHDTLAAFSRDFIEEIQGAPLSYELGVTNMDPRNGGHLYDPWTTDTGHFLRDIQHGVIDCTGWNCSRETSPEETGLEAAYEGIRFMRRQTSQTPPPVEAIDDHARLVTVFFTDEHDGSIHDDNVSEETYIDFFGGPGQTTAFAIGGTQECAENAPSYRDIAQATGGRFASVCSRKLEGIVSDIIATAIASETDYQLAVRPVTASLSIFQESDSDPTQSTFVPRNGEQGFEYFVEDNSVVFYGDYRLEPSEGEVAEDFVAARFEYFIDRCREIGKGADNCMPEE